MPEDFRETADNIIIATGATISLEIKYEQINTFLKWQSFNEFPQIYI